MSAEDDEDAAEYASELLVGRVAEHLSGQDVDASVLTEGLLLRRELVEKWVGDGTPLALLLKGSLLEEVGARVRVPGAGGGSGWTDGGARADTSARAHRVG